jgi:hypothetical protein
MKVRVGAVKNDAFEAEFFGGGFKIADAEAFSEGIDKGEADHLVFVPSDVLAQIFVDLVGETVGGCQHNALINHLGGGEML